MKKLIILMLSVVLVTFLSAREANSAKNKRIQDGVVKVISVVVNPNYSQPWQIGNQNGFTGSGVVIEKGKILTNAHIVANSTYIQVQRQGDPNKYEARIVLTGHDADLSLLEVDDPEFIENTTPLTIGKMPALRDKVAVYRFPIGGDGLYSGQFLGP